jgi:dolichyl-phosphate-mannose-protein mannosyltransferase
MERGILAMRYPYQLDYAEGFLAVESMQIAKGDSIYPSLDDYPYLVGNYPPIYPLLSVPFFLIFGPSLFWGRLICFLSVIGISVLIFFIVFRKEKTILPAFLAPFIFLCTYALFEWIAYARVDLPAVFFSIAGLAMISGRINKKNLRWAIFFFVLSVYTKQVQIFAPLSACIFLIIRNRKTGLRFSCSLIGIGVAVFLFLTAFTGGRFFSHTVLYNANIFSWWQVKRWLLHIFRLYMFSISTVFLIFSTYIYEWFSSGKKWKRKKPGLFTIYLFFCALSVFTIGKIGSASNYLLEFHIGCGVFIGLGIIRILKKSERSSCKYYRYILIVLIAIFLNLHVYQLFRVQRILFSRPNPGKAALKKGDIMLDIIGDYEDPVLCEQPVFPLLSGKEILFQPFIMSQLEKEKKWNQDAFIRDIKNKKFTLIVTGQDIFQEGHIWQYTKDMIESMKHNYKPLLKNNPNLKNFMESGAGGIPYYIYIPENE